MILLKDKIIFFDVDGTLTTEPSIWQSMHRGLGTEVGAYKNYLDFKEGRISYAEWAIADVALWKNIPIEQLVEIASNVSYIQDLKSTIDELKSMDFVIVIISAGLSILTDMVAEYIGADKSYANEINVVDGKVCGLGEGRVNSDGPMNKGEIAFNVSQKFGISLEQCVGVGDTRHDKLMFDVVGLSIVISNDISFIKENNMKVDVTVDNDTLHNIIDPIKEWIKSKESIKILTK